MKYAKLQLNKESIRFAQCFINSKCKLPSGDLFEASEGILIHASRDGFLILRNRELTLETEVMIPMSPLEHKFHVPTAFTNRCFVNADGVASEEGYAITSIRSDSRDHFTVSLKGDKEVIAVGIGEVSPAFEHMLHYVEGMEIVDE